MSIQTITTTTTQPLANSASNPSSHLAIQALSQTEQMNQEVIREINDLLKTLKDQRAEMQNILNVALQENRLLKKEILQLNTKIQENETLHTAEMKKTTQTIATLSNSVTSLTSDLTFERHARRELEKKCETLIGKFNAHNHTTPLNFQGGWRMTNYFSSGPSTPYGT